MSALHRHGHAPLLIVVATFTLAVPAPASVKPCRDASGRVVKCEKARKPVDRCKDASGKFVRCEEGGGKRTSPPAK